MHFKNSVKSTNLKVLLKAVKEVKSTMSTGKQSHTSTTRFTKMRLQHLYCFFVCTVYIFIQFMFLYSCVLFSLHCVNGINKMMMMMMMMWTVVRVYVWSDSESIRRCAETSLRFASRTFAPETTYPGDCVPFLRRHTPEIPPQ